MAPNQSACKQLYLNAGVFSKHAIRYFSESSSVVELKNGRNTCEMLLKLTCPKFVPVFLDAFRSHINCAVHLYSITETFKIRKHLQRFKCELFNSQNPVSCQSSVARFLLSIWPNRAKRIGLLLAC